MKNFKSLFVLIVLLTVFNVQGQKMVMANYSHNLTEHFFFKKASENLSTPNVPPIINNRKYTYRYNGKDVLVYFNRDKHIEYFNNKENYIVSKLNYSSNKEFTLTIIESNLPNFPFGKGTKLDIKITKIKKGWIYYESTLKGYTWEGKMKEVF